jgi:hypothetical protein
MSDQSGAPGLLQRAIGAAAGPDRQWRAATLFRRRPKGPPLHREAKELPPAILRCAAAVPVPLRPARRPVSP